MQRRDDAPDRVVEQHRADACGAGELEAVGGAEERLVLADRLALVVEDGPAAADPARIDVRTARHERARLGLDLLLDLAAEAVGVREAVLDSGLLAVPQVGVVGFAGQRIDNGRLRLGLIARALVGEQVVDHARAGALQDGVRVGKGIVEMCESGGLVQIGVEPDQRVALGFALALPITAVPTTMPSASKATAARLPFGSVIRRGCSTR